MSDLKHIKTWGERAAEKFQADQILYEEAKQQTVIDCMRAEISELRQELARRTQPEATAPAQDLSAAIPDGWQIVPVKPTPEMWAAEAKVDNDAYCGGNHHGASSEQIWHAMLGAAPEPPANALSAGDRVDAERYRHLRELMQFSTPPNKPTTMKLRAPIPAPEHNPHRDWVGDQFDASVDRAVDASLRACLTAAEIVDFDTARAALAKKGGT